MMHRKTPWDARLEGGPFDGDEGELAETYPALWVKLTRGFDEVEWFAVPVKGGEVYVRDEPNGETRTVKYLYKDINYASVDSRPHAAEVS